MKASVKDRMGAFFLDEVIIFVIGVVVGIVVAVNTRVEYMRYGMSLVMMVGILLKDITGQSLGKKLFRLKIVKEDGSDAHAYQLILHNVTDYIWLVELLLVLSSDSGTRLTDKLLHLQVVKIPKIG